MEESLANELTIQATTALEDQHTFHTPEEWEQWRPLITQLYFTEDKTLKFVQKLLADQHNFHAT